MTGDYFRLTALKHEAIDPGAGSAACGEWSHGERWRPLKNLLVYKTIVTVKLLIVWECVITQPHAETWSPLLVFCHKSLADRNIEAIR